MNDTPDIITSEQLLLTDIKLPETPLSEHDCLIEFCEKNSFQLAVITKRFDNDQEKEGFYAVIHQKDKNDFIFKSTLFEQKENAINYLYHTILKDLRALSIMQIKEQLL